MPDAVLGCSSKPIAPHKSAAASSVPAMIWGESGRSRKRRQAAARRANGLASAWAALLPRGRGGALRAVRGGRAPSRADRPAER